jgi:hypothetical protein
MRKCGCPTFLSSRWLALLCFELIWQNHSPYLANLFTTIFWHLLVTWGNSSNIHPKGNTVTGRFYLQIVTWRFVINNYLRLITGRQRWSKMVEKKLLCSPFPKMSFTFSNLLQSFDGDFYNIIRRIFKLREKNVLVPH